MKMSQNMQDNLQKSLNAIEEAAAQSADLILFMLVSRILRQSSHIFCPIVKQKFDLVMHQHPRTFLLSYLPAPLLQ